jgi:hypothetical protein
LLMTVKVSCYKFRWRLDSAVIWYWTYTRLAYC